MSTVKESKQSKKCCAIAAAMGEPDPQRMSAVARKIEIAISEDRDCRFPGVSAGTYGIAQLEPFARLGHGFTVLRKVSLNGSRVPEFQRATSDAEFQQRFYKDVPWLAKFDLKKNGLCLAGGAAGALLMFDNDHRRGTYSDFDLFLVGHQNDQSAKEAIYALHSYLSSHITGNIEESFSGKVFRTQGCITFTIDTNINEVHRTTTIQVILRQYATQAEVIHSFDMGSSAFIWDGVCVTMTAMGKMAAEHGVNILNLPARRKSYECRLQRYFERGYDLLLPRLNTCAFLAKKGSLPHLYAFGLEAGKCPCSITATAITALTGASFGVNETFPSIDEQNEASCHREASCYGPSVPYGNMSALLSRNIGAIDTSDGKVYTGALCAMSDLENISAYGLCNSFEPAIDTTMLMNAVLNAFGSANDAPDPQVSKIRKLLGQAFATELVMEYMSTGKVPTADRVLSACKARAAILNPKAKIPFEIMRVEDNTGLIPAHSRAVMSEAEWYGECYIR